MKYYENKTTMFGKHFHKIERAEKAGRKVFLTVYYTFFGIVLLTRIKIYDNLS